MKQLDREKRNMAEDLETRSTCRDFVLQWFMYRRLRKQGHDFGLSDDEDRMIDAGAVKVFEIYGNTIHDWIQAQFGRGALHWQQAVTDY